MMRCLRIPLPEDTAEFGQFLHEVSLDVQSTRGVEQKNVTLPTFGGRIGIIGNSSRVSSMVTGNEFELEAVGPRPKLLDRRRPEGVTGPEEDGSTFFLEAMPELGAGSCLAGTVDSHQADYLGSGGAGLK